MFETWKPAEASVFGDQIAAKVPPPPSVTQMLGCCPSKRARGSPKPIGLPLVSTVPPPPWILTSLTIDASPAFHRSAVARGFTPPVHRPRPETIALPPFALCNNAFGPPTPMYAGVSSGR